MEKKESEINYSLKLLAKTSFIVLISLLFSKLFMYIYRIIIARYFGPEVYGLFSIGLMILGIFVAVSSLGLAEGLLRFIPIYRGRKEQQKISHLLRFSLIISLISGILAAVILFFSANFISISFFHNSGLILYLKIFSFLIPITLFSNIFLQILRTHEEIKWYSFIQNILQNITKLVFLILFIFIGLKSGAVALSYFLGILSLLVFSYIICRNKFPNLLLKTNLKEAKRTEMVYGLFSYSWPLILLGIIGNIFNWTDSFMLGYFQSARDVGFYNAAIPIVTFLIISQEVFMQLFFPLINREYGKKNFILIRELSKQVAKWIFIVNLPLFFMFMLFPGVIINLLFGNQYLAAENVVRFLAVSTLFYSICSIPSSLLYMIGKSKLIFTNTLILSIVNFILNLILIPPYGVNGAAFATMLSSLILCSLLVIQANKYLSVLPIKRKMLQILLVSLIPVTLLLLAKPLIPITLFALILTGLAFFLVYFALIYFTKCLDENDLLILKSVTNKLKPLLSRLF